MGHDYTVGLMQLQGTLLEFLRATTCMPDLEAWCVQGGGGGGRPDHKKLEEQVTIIPWGSL